MPRTATSGSRRSTSGRIATPCRGIVAAIRPDGAEVALGPRGRIVVCDLLWGPLGPPRIAIGDAVLVVPPAARRGRGCLLGTIGPSVGHGAVVVEAPDGFEVRSGSARLTLGSERAELRARDLLVAAERRTRIAGGTVDIN